jgi:DNA polymerase-3 subunit epsilon
MSLRSFLGSLFQSPPWDEQTYWALDLETTGFSAKSDQILSIGMVPIRRGVIRNGESFYSLVRPLDPSRLDTTAIRAHHILPSELEGAPRLGFLLPDIDRKLREGVLLLHFSHLDLGFLRRAYRGTGMPWPGPRVVDTVRLILKAARRERFTSHHPAPWPTSLAGAREKLGLPPHAWHHALADAVATAELFLALRSRLGAKKVRELF